MADKKKFTIKGVKNDLSYCEAGKIILSSKLNEIFILIAELFEDDCSENIHKLRIGLRDRKSVV